MRIDQHIITVRGEQFVGIYIYVIVMYNIHVYSFKHTPYLFMHTCLTPTD